MAIMWDAPLDAAPLADTPAELAWRQWLQEALLHRAADAGEDASPARTTPAADQAQNFQAFT